MRQTKTLAAIAADIENGNIYYHETTIKAGQFGTFADFLSYYNAHYRPILQAIADGEDLTAQPAALLRFMAQDLLDVFAEDTDTDQGEDVSDEV